MFSWLFSSRTPSPASRPAGAQEQVEDQPQSPAEQRAANALESLKRPNAAAYAQQSAMADAQALVDAGETGLAVDVLAAVLVQRPENPVRAALVKVLLMQGAFEVASRLLVILAADPEFARDAELKLGELAEDSGRLPDARRHYERAMALEPDHPLARERSRRLRAKAEQDQAGQDGAFHALSRVWGEAAAGGRFDVQEEVGRGGAATLFRARERATGRDVALKVFHPRGDPLLRADRIRREAALTARFPMPGVVPILDVLPERDLIVMGFVPGGSLKLRLAHGPMPLAVALPMLEQVARVLDALHQAGVAHLDIKPSNVLMQGNAPVLADFGAAAAHDVGQAAGTPPYMAPEQRTGAAVGPKADLYAFGVMLVECVTGHPATAIPAWVDSGHPGERALAMLARSLTQEDPSLRPPSAAAVADALLWAASLK